MDLEEDNIRLQQNAKKRRSELQFWSNEALLYQEWFSGKRPLLYKTPSPSQELRERFGNDAQAPMRAWNSLHQIPKYLADLELPVGALRKKIVLDLGSGPFPSAAGLQASRLLCLDALSWEYRKCGYPVQWGEDIEFIAGVTEAIPLARNSVDAVISVNALDHVDDIQLTAQEIHRVLRPGGWLRFHLHFHAPTVCEPVAFTDTMVDALFSWAPDLQLRTVTRQNFSTTLPESECFKLWSNF